MQEDKAFFKKMVEKYQIKTIIFGRQDITPWAQNFLSFITTEENWIILYSDNYSIVLVRKGLIQ
jgi:hypothetical protein